MEGVHGTPINLSIIMKIQDKDRNIIHEHVNSIVSINNKSYLGLLNMSQEYFMFGTVLVRTNIQNY